MSNTSLFAAFERFWQYVVALVGESVGESVTGQEFEVEINGAMETITAANGAEIFNDYENNIATGQMSHAEGSGTVALGDSSHTEGISTITNGEGTHAEGYFSKALYDYAHAEGEETVAYGYGAHSEGEYTAATNDAAHAEGGGWTRNFTLSGSNCEYTIESGKTNGLAVGNIVVYKNLITKIDELDLDNLLIITYDDLGTLASGNVLVFLGGYASEYAAHSEGDSTIASGYASHTEGMNTIASEDATHAEGSNTKALYFAAHAEGSDNIAANFADHAEGSTTIAAGGASHAEGDSTYTFDYGAHAEGDWTVATGAYSHAEGCTVATSGYAAHAEGFGNTIVAIITKISSWTFQLDKQYDIGEGDVILYHNQDVFGWGSIAEYDSQNLTIKLNSASNEFSIDKLFDTGWEGEVEIYNKGVAYGDYSHVEGKESKALGRYSHVQGNNTIAPQAFMDIIGSFNKVDYAYEKTTETNYSITLTNLYHIDNFVFNSEVGKFTPINKATESSNHTNIIIGDLYVKGDSDRDGFYTEVYEIIGEPELNTPPYGSSYYSALCYKYYTGTSVKGKYAHIVGNGTSETNRSNAHTIDWEGNAWFAGNIKIGGTGYNDPDAQLISGGGSGMPIPEQAAVGQFIVVSAVDENGRVTATEAITVPQAEEVEL